MAYNSDGYIMIDFAEVDFRRTTQTIEGLFDRCKKIIGANKFVIVINANGKTPLPSSVSITNGQYVIESSIYSFSINSSDILHITSHTHADEIIDDSHVTNKTTYSSQKIENLLDSVTINNLNDIGDVDINEPTNNQVISYDSESGKFTNKSLSINPQINSNTYPQTLYSFPRNTQITFPEVDITGVTGSLLIIARFNIVASSGWNGTQNFRILKNGNILEEITNSGMSNSPASGFAYQVVAIDNAVATDHYKIAFLSTSGSNYSADGILKVTTFLL